MKSKRIIFFCLLGLLATSATIDLNNLFNYVEQGTPVYFEASNEISKNRMDDARSTLGRVLFYDKNLSIDNSISCASCHHQQFAFGDTAQLSKGVNGTTARHSMRLVNPLFNNEGATFWDKRAVSFEDQALRPIKDHVEMGFSDSLDQPGFDSLLRKMEQLPYYSELFSFVYGDAQITAERMEWGLANFVRSIQSFDSRYDEGRSRSFDPKGPFPNFTPQENRGMALFLDPAMLDSTGTRLFGGAGCNNCHRAPQFDIRAGYFNNGVIEGADGSTDTENYRSPSLRDLFNEDGVLHGPLMHNGKFESLRKVIDHYDDIPQSAMNEDLSEKLQENGHPQKLLLTEQDKEDLETFLKTLTGKNLYTDEKWSDPFVGDQLDFVLGIKGIDLTAETFKAYPNPVIDVITLLGPAVSRQEPLRILDLSGKVMFEGMASNKIDLSQYPIGIYLFILEKKVLKVSKI